MNKGQSFFIAVAIAMLGQSNAFASPPSCDNTFQGNVNSFWHEPANWSTGLRPDDSEVACIKDGATVLVWYAAPGQCRAGAVYIDSTSTVSVRFGDDLTLCAGSGCVASQIDGELEVYFGSSVILGQSMTINGSGAIQMGIPGGSSGIATIEGASGVPTLTLGSGLTVEGFGDIEVKLTNHGTVLAKQGTLKLVEGGDGSGVWTAKGSTGRLLVQGEVKGSGSWVLTDNASAKIEIDAACECLTGSAQVTLGTLDVDANFRTTGQLGMGGPNSLIDVAGTKSAKFSMQSVLPACVGGGGDD